MEKAHLISKIDQDKKAALTSPTRNYSTKSGGSLKKSVTDVFKSFFNCKRNQNKRSQKSHLLSEIY